MVPYLRKGFSAEPAGSVWRIFTPVDRMMVLFLKCSSVTFLSESMLWIAIGWSLLSSVCSVRSRKRQVGRWEDTSCVGPGPGHPHASGPGSALACIVSHRAHRIPLCQQMVHFCLSRVLLSGVLHPFLLQFITGAIPSPLRNKQLRLS